MLSVDVRSRRLRIPIGRTTRAGTKPCARIQKITRDKQRMCANKLTHRVFHAIGSKALVRWYSQPKQSHNTNHSSPAAADTARSSFSWCEHESGRVLSIHKPTQCPSCLLVEFSSSQCVRDEYQSRCWYQYYIASGANAKSLFLRLSILQYAQSPYLRGYSLMLRNASQ